MDKSTFYYVYLLRSDANPKKHYTGVTVNLERRLSKHNAGCVSHTSKYLPWHIHLAIAFRSKSKAVRFERYLKTHSGKAFTKKHF